MLAALTTCGVNVFTACSLSNADNADHSYDNGESGELKVRFLGTYKSTAFDSEVRLLSYSVKKKDCIING